MGSYVLIPINGRSGLQGYAKVDIIDAPLVADKPWHLHSDGYPVHTIKGRKVYMHRLITDAPQGLEVDHDDQDKLNNQRHNLVLRTKVDHARISLARRQEQLR